MRLIFVHGWSVTNTDTYGKLPDVLGKTASVHKLQLDIEHIYLGRYISFHDEVTVDDIARAMDEALRDLPGNSSEKIEPFSCITHSTGGPVVRSWVDKFYGKSRLEELPLKHLIMLAPANHGSALAALGKSRISRLKAWFDRVEPGQRVLDWLRLGSDGQWKLNHECIEYDFSSSTYFPFVLTGQGIDSKFYDSINTYLKESGSDGVIRITGANMNYKCLSFEQEQGEVIRKKPLTLQMALKKKDIESHQPVALKVYNKYSHSGKKMGIMGSIEITDTKAPVVEDIFRCLKVENREEYRKCAEEMAKETESVQKDGSRYCMLVFNIRDDQGEVIGKDNYDLLLLAGNQYKETTLPKSFLIDKQMNDDTGRLVFYLDSGKMEEIKNGKFGLKVVARPTKGFSYYAAGEFHSEDMKLDTFLVPNQVTYIDIKLHRFVDQNTFRFGKVTEKPVEFKKTKPAG